MTGRDFLFWIAALALTATLVNCAKGIPYGGGGPPPGSDELFDAPITWHNPHPTAPVVRGGEACGEGQRVVYVAMLVSEDPLDAERHWSVTQTCRVATCWDGRDWKVEALSCAPNPGPEEAPW